MKGIHALVVNAYDPRGEKGSSMYQTYISLIRSLLGKESVLVEKKVDELGDYVLNWEHAILEEHSKSVAKRFDKFDMIFLSGDCKSLPWEKHMHDVILLLHMCNYVQKPVVCTGSGAFHAMYALCTRGTTFDIINGPNGNALDRLAAYGKYANGSKEHPSVWLDSETGDVYRYDRKSKSWMPTCCVGSNRLPAYGIPSSGTVKPATKKYARDNRRLNEQPEVQALDSGNDVVVVRNAVQQHYLLHKLPLPKFVMPLPSEWHLNTDGGLPRDGNMCVLADGSCGPVLATFHNCLLLAVEIAHGPAYTLTRQILKNFVRQQIVRMQGEDSKVTAAARFVDRLFGPEGKEDVSREAQLSKAETLASSMVPSALSCGPDKVGSLYSPRPTPVRDVVVQPGAGDHFDYTALLSPRGNTTLGKKVPVAQKREGAVRTKRLDIFLASQGHPEMQPLNKKAAKLAIKMAGKTVTPGGYDCMESARATIGEEYLRKPKKAVEDVFIDNRQLRPPAIHFDRPKSANTVGGRWTGKQHLSSKPVETIVTDHMCGDNGVAHRSDKNRPSSVEASFLPRKHPSRKTSIPELVDRKGNKIGPAIPAKSQSQSTLLVPVVHVENEPVIPFTNHKKYQRMIKEETEMDRIHAPFQGTYSQPFRTDHEMAVHEYNESKKNFLAGEFRTQFGVASQIPLRPRGIIGGASSYPKCPTNTQGLKGNDFVVFTKEEGPEQTGNKWINC